MCEDALYHIQLSSNVQTGKGNPKKSILSRKCGRDATIDKERVFLEFIEHIDSHSDKQFDITVLGKMMEEKLSGNNLFYIWFKQICFADPVLYRYSNADYVTTNKW